MSLWPFIPFGEATEVLAWRTDVLRARGTEQRFRLRERPRRQWHFRHRFSADEQAAARAILRGGSSLLVPDWTRAIYTGGVSAGASVSLAFDTTGMGLAAGQSVVLWNGVLDCEVCTIQSVAPGALVLSFVATGRASVKVYRLDVAQADGELAFSRPSGPFQFAEISFEAPAVDTFAASTYSQYRGHDVLNVVPVVGAGSLSESFDWPVERFDNETGRFAASHVRDLPDDKFMMRWHAVDKPEIYALRAWIASRYGRWLAFWHSTRQKDLVCAADIGSSATTIRVFSPIGATTLGRSAFDIEIIVPSGPYFRSVTSVSAGPSVSGRQTFDMTIDSALGVAVVAAAVGRISYLRCSRFDSDRIELLHRPCEGLAVAVPCIEVPVP